MINLAHTTALLRVMLNVSRLLRVGIYLFLYLAEEATPSRMWLGAGRTKLLFV